MWPSSGVFPHEATRSDVAPVGDLLMVSTSNGLNEGHTHVPSPRAPSLIAVNERFGRRGVARHRRGRAGAARPVVQPCGGQRQRAHAGALRRRRSLVFGPTTQVAGHHVWRFDGNLKNARWLPRPGVLSRSFIIASPVFASGRVFVAMGQTSSARQRTFTYSRDPSQRPGRRHPEQAPLDFS